MNHKTDLVTHGYSPNFILVVSPNPVSILAIVKLPDPYKVVPHNTWSTCTVLTKARQNFVPILKMAKAARVFAQKLNRGFIGCCSVVCGRILLVDSSNRSSHRDLSPDVQ